MLVLRRVRKAHFGLLNEALSPLGLPLFALLLLRSRLHYRWRKQVRWKGRTYPQMSSGDTSVRELEILKSGDLSNRT
jgi:hypothetical protein